MNASLLLSLVLSTALYGFQAHAKGDCHQGGVKAKAAQYQRALDIWEKAALDASPKEKLRADINCLRHNRIAVDDAAIAKWMMKRADESIPSAQLYTGMLFATGVGVKRDVEAARKWLKLAETNGHPDAAFLLKTLDEPERGK